MLFSGKNKKNVTNMASAEFAIEWYRLKCSSRNDLESAAKDKWHSRLIKEFMHLLHEMADTRCCNV